MQNRYVADIGDYVKLAILRALALGRGLGVVWWIFPDEPNSTHGAHREYLQRPNEWKHFDPDLFEALLKIEKKQERQLCALEKPDVLPNALFVSDPVPCEVRPFSVRPVERSKWLAEIRTKLKDCNLVFLDPDNGIAQEGLRLTRRRAGKSVTIEEMKALQESKRAMVVYHHQTRYPGGHHCEICDLAARLKNSGLNVSGVLRAKPWSPRAFFILNGDKELRERAKKIAELWGNWISWHPFAEILRPSLPSPPRMLTGGQATSKAVRIVPTAAPAREVSMNKTTRRQILRAEREQERAINHRDVRGALKMFDPSFVGFSSTQHSRIRGLGALAKTFHYYLKRAPKMTYRVEQPHVHASGSAAVATFYWTVGLGGRRRIHGRGTHVFAHKGKHWRVIHEHFSRAH